MVSVGWLFPSRQVDSPRHHFPQPPPHKAAAIPPGEHQREFLVLRVQVVERLNTDGA